MASAKDNLKINKNGVTFAELVNIYASVENSANNDPNDRGGSNELWSKLEGAVDRYSTQTGEKFETVWKKVKQTYSDQTKQGRGSAGRTGMTAQRAEY